MMLQLQPFASMIPAGVRQVRDTDIDALALLMWSAYRDTIDDSGETIDDARREIQKTFAGSYGAFDQDVSLLLERDGLVASAVLVTHLDDSPFICFCMTTPSHQRKGLSRALLCHIAGRLHSQGESQLKLVVTAANAPAVCLYKSLGFRIS